MILIIMKIHQQRTRLVHRLVNIRYYEEEVGILLDQGFNQLIVLGLPLISPQTK